jgi:hypothetical protein
VTDRNDTPTTDPVQQVFDLWRGYRPNPAYCRLTAARRKLLAARLRDYSAADLCALVRYAFESDAAEARFWRGENDRRAEYTDLVNLLRVSKLDGRVERALLWRDAMTAQAATERDGLDLGPMGALLRGPRGEA